MSNPIAEALVRASHVERMEFFDALIAQWRVEEDLLSSDLMKWAYQNSRMEVLIRDH